MAVFLALAVMAAAATAVVVAGDRIGLRADAGKAATPPIALPLLFRGRLEPVGGVHEIGAYGAAPTETLGRLDVAEGDRVAAGQVIARLASSERAAAALASAQAAVMVAERRLDNVRRPFKDAELEALRAAARARAAEFDLADRQQRRSETLHTRGVATLVDQDIKATEVRTARSRLREAEANLAAMEQVSATRIALEEAQLAEARARETEAREALALTLIRAPADGTVLAVRARAGQALAPPGRILDMADLTRLKVVAEVDERFVGRIRPGQKAALRLRGGDRSWPASVVRIGTRVELVTRPTTDAVTGLEARFVDVDLEPESLDGIPRVTGLEVIVRFDP
ncbi:MAG: efflux RND transporter periplasmic adaptor subunit [Alphaproteobacteria bacterium]|nr:efflux RND transporter periplasmic adaptor subunit [Alphaproteobacteria bacterium]